MKRYSALLLVLLMLCSLTVACGESDNGKNGAAEQPKEIKILLPEHPYGDLLVSMIDEFESETGIKVIVTRLNEGEITAMQIDAIAKDIFIADIFMTRPMTEALNFLNNDWMMPLEDHDISDYPANTLEIGLKDGKPHFIPLIVEWQVLYYRKDLLQAAGLNVPADLNELENIAKILNRNGISGFASRGAGSPAVSQLSGFIYNFGGRYIEDGKAAFDSPEALEAISYYGRILGMSGPNGVSKMSWSEIMALFQTGKLAMWTDASVFYGQLIDPEVSQVPAEYIGVARLPGGPAAEEPYIMTSWGMSISSKTGDMDSSMKFLNWATGSEIAKKAMLENIPMARSSVWSDPSVTAGINPEIVDTMIHASEHGYPYAMPFMTSIIKARELIGEVIEESINTSGTSPRLQSLAVQKASEVNDLLRADGEYGTAR